MFVRLIYNHTFTVLRKLYTLYITFILLLATTVCNAQLVIKGSIKDVEDGSPLSFCSVAIKGTGKGSLANEDGAFSITVEKSSDILIFYYLGYERKEIEAGSLTNNASITLKQVSKSLDEVTVYSGDERLYDLMVKCRNKLLRSKKQFSKAYFQLTSKANEQPVEMLECYYNATVKGSSIQDLALKNGRAGLAEFDHRYFISFNTSLAIRYLDLVQENEYLPTLPLQLSKRAMKKYYSLKTIGGDEYSYHIAFTPKKYPRAYFSGDMWIDKKTGAIQKIQLICDNTVVHPFIPFAEDTLKSVSLHITHTYEEDNGATRLNHVNFSYSLMHKPIRSFDSLGHKFHNLPEKEINTTGIIYFYDYGGSPFILPKYEYDPQYTDFRKISLIPYNPSFWENANGLLHSQEQKNTLEFLEQYGELINFTNHRLSDSSRKGFYETNNYTWTDSTRINYTRNIVRPGRNGNPFSQMPYTLSAQIYFDINSNGSGYDHFSATEFDAMNTYVPEPIDSVAKCFMNIYFDLYEIERRKMEQQLSVGERTAQEMEAIYNGAMKNIKETTKEYLNEVNAGQNTEALKKWNDHCLQQLGFDNMRIFKVATADPKK